MKILERDVILVNKLHEVKLLIDMTESFIRYVCIKEGKPSNISEEKPEKQEEKEPKPLKKNNKTWSKKTEKKQDETLRRTWKKLWQENGNVIANIQNYTQ